jgi:hypothetical protein
MDFFCVVRFLSASSLLIQSLKLEFVLSSSIVGLSKSQVISYKGSERLERPNPFEEEESLSLTTSESNYCP